MVFARTSEPPCFSVMAMPIVSPAFWLSGTLRGSYTGAVIFGNQASASAGVVRRAGTAANVIVIGQMCPASAWLCRYTRAARATCAPGRGSRQGDPCRPFSIECCISAW